jgi:hypothetical protein
MGTASAVPYKDRNKAWLQPLREIRELKELPSGAKAQSSLVAPSTPRLKSCPFKADRV